MRSKIIDILEENEQLLGEDIGVGASMYGVVADRIMKELEAGQHETIVMWHKIFKEMPDTKHVERRTQFLLKGAYGTPGRLGSTCYIVSRLDEAAYTCGVEIVFETPVDFIAREWTNIY